MAPSTRHSFTSISPASSTIVMQSLRRDLVRAMVHNARPSVPKTIDNPSRIGGSATEPDLLHAARESHVHMSPEEGEREATQRISTDQSSSRPRHEPEKPSNVFPPRRSLFKQYWGKGEDSHPASGKASPREHAVRTDVDIRQFSPPAEHCKSLRDYHSLVDEFPNGEVPSKHVLPTIPASLRRWTSDIVNSHGKGMYPLMSPTSILRKLSRWKSQGDVVNDADDDLESKAITQARHNFELTKSFRGSTDSSLSQNAVHIGQDDHNEIERSLQQAKKKKGKHTHFDPRIVITEFQDQEPRLWYSEEELTCMRNETIMLAQQYMLMHPELEEFTKPDINPVTGRTRKRALYSLPVLNSIPGDFDLAKENERVDSTVKYAVQNILVVDPNEAILNLFCKCLQKMFPHAKLFAVQTGEEALRLYTTEMAKRGHSKGDNFRVFDIIIAEERLTQQRRKKVGVDVAPFDSTRKGHRQSISFSKLPSTCPINPLRPNTNIEKHLSVSSLYINDKSAISSLDGRGMSGSVLIRKIRELEEQAYGGEGQSGTSYLLDVGINVLPPYRTESKDRENRALLIGVSVNMERDGDNLRNSGADLIWGKPPPAMGIPLRNRIVSALLTKRQGSDLCLCLQN